MKGRRLSLVVLAVLVMLVFGGQALFAAGSAEKKVKTFAYFIPHQGNSFMVGLAQNMIEAGKDQGVIVKVYTADNDPAKQNSQVDEAIAQKVDGIMLEPASFDGLTAAVKAVLAAKIPIITVHELRG